MFASKTVENGAILNVSLPEKYHDPKFVAVYSLKPLLCVIIYLKVRSFREFSEF